MKLQHADIPKIAKRKSLRLAVAGAILLSACAETATLPKPPVTDTRSSASILVSRGPSTFDDRSARVLRSGDGLEIRVFHPDAPLLQMVRVSERYESKSTESKNILVFSKFVNNYFMYNGQLATRILSVGVGTDKATRTSCDLVVGFNRVEGKDDTLEMRGFEYRCMEGERMQDAKIAITLKPNSMTAFVVPYNKDGRIIGALPNGDFVVFGLTFVLDSQQAMGGWAILRNSPGDPGPEAIDSIKGVLSGENQAKGGFIGQPVRRE